MITLGVWSYYPVSSSPYTINNIQRLDRARNRSLSFVEHGPGAHPEFLFVGAY